MITSAKGRAAQNAQTIASYEHLELLKCQSNPQHFIEKYVKIRNPSVGPVNFLLYGTQEILIDSLEQRSQVLVKHPRQAGITAASLAYFLWSALFENNCTSVVIMRSIPHRQYAADLVRKMYDSVPSWLKSQLTRATSSKMVFANGSTIIFIGSDSFGHGLRAKNLMFGDFSFVSDDDQADMWYSYFHILADPKTRIIIQSTPSGRSTDFFAKLWMETVQGRTPFYALDLKFWHLHDASQAKWDQLEAILGKDVMRREYGCEIT